jgi:hypothetical protein
LFFFLLLSFYLPFSRTNDDGKYKKKEEEEKKPTTMTDLFSVLPTYQNIFKTQSSFGKTTVCLFSLPRSPHDTREKK